VEGAPLTTLDDVLTRLERDRDKHMLSPAAGPDLLVLEREIGRALPDAVRRLLERVGGGIIYERHELFGPRRLMIHDIELVPDVLSMRRALRSRPEGLAEHLLPLHRCEGLLHHVDLSAPGTSVVSDDGQKRYVDLGSFLSSTLWNADGTPSSA
jgi:hypothetical protein